MASVITTLGSIIITAAALISPYSGPRSVVRPAITTGSVFEAGPLKIRANRNSFQETKNAKMAAIASYHSQFVAGRDETPPTFLYRLRDEAAYWGKTIGVNYGEPFACREPVGLRSLRDLV